MINTLCCEVVYYPLVAAHVLIPKKPQNPLVRHYLGGTVGEGVVYTTP